MSDRWYEQEGAESTAKMLLALIKHLDERQGYRRELNRKHMSLYMGREVISLDGSDYANPNQEAMKIAEIITYNVTRSIVDTICSTMAMQKPRIQFLSIAGDWGARQQAKKLSYFTDGQFHSTRFYKKGRIANRMATVFGTGATKLIRENNDVGALPVFTDDLIVDDVEARLGEPRNLYQHAEASKDLLIAKFPKHKEKIQAARWTRRDAHTSSDEKIIDRPISTIEAWHLPSGPDAKDGRHVWAIEGTTLEDEKWTVEKYPFSFRRWADPLMGFWGIGVPEILAPIQGRIQELARKIAEAEDLNVPAVMLQKGSKVNRKKWKNLSWFFIEYTGPTAPKPWLVPSISPEFYQDLERLMALAYELVGVSQLSAQAKKPAGLNSGEAQRVYHDIGSERMAESSMDHEEYFLDAADQMISIAKQIDEAGDGGYKTMSIRRIGSEEVADPIKWSDVNLDRSRYIMRPYPAGFLPQTPAGKLEKSKELIEAFPQLQDQAVSLLGDIPDIDGAVSLATADLDEVDQLAEHYLDGGDYMPPDPDSNLELMKRRLRQHLQHSKIRKAPENVLKNFRDTLTAITDLEAIAEKKAAAAAAAAAPPPGLPGMMPPPGPAGPPPGPAGLPPGMPVDPGIPPELAELEALAGGMPPGTGQ